MFSILVNIGFTFLIIFAIVMFLKVNYDSDRSYENRDLELIKAMNELQAAREAKKNPPVADPDMWRTGDNDEYIAGLDRELARYDPPKPLVTKPTYELSFDRSNKSQKQLQDDVVSAFHSNKWGVYYAPPGVTIREIRPTVMHEEDCEFTYSLAQRQPVGCTCNSLLWEHRA